MKTYKLFIALLLLASCSSKQEEVISEDVAEEITTEEVVTSTSDPLQQKQFMGTIDVFPNGFQNIHSPVDGILRSIQVIPGQQVRKGQLLATVESVTIIETQNSFYKAKADYEFWKNEQLRKKELFDQKIIPQKEYDNAVAQYQASRTQYESLENLMKLYQLPQSGSIQSSMRLVAPFDGYLVAFNVKNGEHISGDMLLFSIVNPKEKFIAFNVFPEDAQLLKIGDTISFSENGSETVYKSKIQSISQMVNPELYTIEIISVPIDDWSSLRVGNKVFSAIEE